MKKIIFFLAFLPTALFSQIYVEGYDINADEEITYCQVSGGPSLGSSVRLIIDYGQKINTFKTRMVIGDKDNEKLRFNSMVDVINFMHDNGWELVTSFYHPERNCEKYTFKRRE